MKLGLKDYTIADIQNVFATFPEIEEAIIYGSRAKGNFKNGSDIDLALRGEALNLTILNQILLKLDDLFLPYKFDISIYHQINNLDLLDHIRRVGISFYKKNDL